MTITRSTDYAAIRELLTEPRAYRRMSCDQVPAEPTCNVGARAGVEYVLAQEAGADLAVFQLTDGAPTAASAAELHMCFAPQARGLAAGIFTAFLLWVWAETPYARLVGPVPAYNRLALRLLRRCGCTEVAFLKNVCTKHGSTYDVLLLEIRKP